MFNKQWVINRGNIETFSEKVNKCETKEIFVENVLVKSKRNIQRMSTESPNVCIH